MNKNIFKNRSTIVSALAVLVVLLITGIYSCKKPTEGVNVIVETSSLSKAPTLVVFSNANKSSTTPVPSSFSVTISGTGAQYVQMDGGGQNFTTNNGFLPLSLVKGASPSASNPIVFNVYASVPGYAPVSKTISISTDTAITQVTVPLVEYANPPAGSSVLTTTTALTGNAVASATNLTTTTNAGLSETATLSIPAGTQLLDASGAVISASSLSSSIIQYGTSNQLIGESFPGGLSPANVLDANGKPISGGVQFVTAGALGINMQAANTTVKGFSKPITATVQLQSGMVNFTTGNPVQAGETIPVWSYNEVTGQWKSDGTATIALDGSGKLAASFSITHLTIWNLDWTWYPNPTFNSVVHNLAVNFIPSSTPWSGTYFVQLQTANGNLLADWIYYPQTDYYIQEAINPTGVFQVVPNVTIKGKYGFGLTVVPNISQAKVMIYNMQTGVYTYSALFNPTTTSTVNVNIAAPAQPSYVNVALNINALCTTKSIVAKPTGWFYLYDVTSGSYYAYVYLYNGYIYYVYLASSVKSIASNGANSSLAVQLVSGHSYWIASYYNGAYNQSGNFTATNSAFSIPLSSSFTGSTSYNSSTSTVTINGTVTLKCN